MGQIVIGVDGSELSLASRHRSLEEAQLRGAELVAICAWTPPVVFPAGSSFADDAAAFEADARETLDRCLGIAGDPVGVTVTSRVVEGPPALRLVEVSGRAELDAAVGEISGLVVPRA